MSATCSLTNIPICSCVPHNEIGLPPVGQIGDINMFDFLTLPYLCVRTVNIHDSGESKHTDRLTTTEDGRDNTTVSQLLETHNTISPYDNARRRHPTHDKQIRLAPQSAHTLRTHVSFQCVNLNTIPNVKRNASDLAAMAANHIREGDASSPRTVSANAASPAVEMVERDNGCYNNDAFVYEDIEPTKSSTNQHQHEIRHVVYVVLIVAYAAYFTAAMQYEFGSEASVRWRPVLWGLGLQFVFGLVVLRTPWGFAAFRWLGDRVQEFLSHTDVGAKFVFGDKFVDHPFAMKVLPVIIFFSCTISVLYHVGAMQAVITRLAWLMQYTMGTTAAESTNAAGNIFIGQTEAPLLIRPLLQGMTRSELHAVMVAGFASIAGAVLATYILLGVPANHLITASVMAAPCALALSKLSYPETGQTKLSEQNITRPEER
ncbi:hypothetical protein LSAT2_018126 [Lamellibrachia satsuma]|nr:hypothetical protein LSAT2_018126 [Lamellibrachia satsuma]